MPTDRIERERTSEAQLESYQLAHVILAAARGPMVILDAGLRVRAANLAFLRSFGLGSGEVAGRSIYDLVDGRWDVPALRSLLEDALRGDIEPEDCSIAHCSRDGGRRSLILSARRIDSRSGRPEAVVLAVEDVTERVRAGDTQPEPERLGGTALDSLTAHIVVLDEAGTIVAFSQSWRDFARARGADEAAVSEGANYLRAYDKAMGEGAEEAAAFAAGVRDVLSGRSETFELGYPCHAPDRWRWFVGRVTRLRGDGPLRVVVAHEEMTGRERAEEALRKSEERFRQLAENIHDVFWMTDVPELRVLYISPAYEEIWGRTCRSLYEQPLSWIDAIHPDDRETIIAHLKQLRRGEFWVKEYRVVRPDGSVRWIRDRAFPIKDQAGNVYRIAGVAEDITERKRHEETIAEQMRLAAYGRDVGLA